MKKWYALRVVSGQENKILKLIKSMAEDSMFSVEVGDVHVPTELVVSTRNGKQYTQKRRLLPGYALIELDMPQTGWRTLVSELRAIDGVIGFASAVSLADKPQPLTEEEAKDMLRFGKEGIAGKPVRMRQMFKQGETVNILEGPFIGFSGNVEEVDEQKSTLRVSVEIFGRVTPIDLNFEQVEKI